MPLISVRDMKIKDEIETQKKEKEKNYERTNGWPKLYWKGKS